MPSSADNIIALYEKNAHSYVADRRRVTWDERGWLDRFIALVPNPGTLLDIGCGCGEPIAKYLIDQNFAVQGVDSSPTLISICRARFPKQRWQVGDMRTLALREKFQGILAWDSFFHLRHEDQRQMFPIFKAHAADGAALIFTSGGFHGEAIGSYHGEALYHASLAPEEYRALLAANGFRVKAHMTDDPQCGNHTIWLAQAVG